MMPHALYHRPGVTLYHGDCQAILPALDATTAIVSDPPYGIAYWHSGGGKGLCGLRNDRQPLIGDDTDFDPSPLLAFDRVLLWGADHFRARLPEGGTLLSWDKTGGGRGPKDSFADAEYAWSSCRTKRNCCSLLWKGCCRERKGEERRRCHPTQKPIRLMEWCLDIVDPDRTLTICDPFMGSGSTIIACIRTGRPCIGIELDERYFSETVRRVEAELCGQETYSASATGACPAA